MDLKIDTEIAHKILDEIHHTNIYTIIDDILIITFDGGVESHILYLYYDEYMIEITRRYSHLYRNRTKSYLSNCDIIQYAKLGVKIMQEQFNLASSADDSECLRILKDHLMKK